jgi:hypothetical protein
MDKHLMGRSEIPSNKHIGLLKVVKEVLLMDSLGHPRSTIVCLWAILICIGLLRLVVVAHGRVKIPLFTVRGLGPATIASA